MAISRQKISAALRKHGIPSSKWSKGRVTWRASEGYDLMMYGFNGRVAEIGYNVRIGFNWTDRDTELEEAGLREIEAALEAEGLRYERRDRKVAVLDPR